MKKRDSHTDFFTLVREQHQRGNRKHCCIFPLSLNQMRWYHTECPRNFDRDGEKWPYCPCNLRRVKVVPPSTKTAQNTYTKRNFTFHFDCKVVGSRTWRQKLPDLAKRPINNNLNVLSGYGSWYRGEYHYWSRLERDWVTLRFFSVNACLVFEQSKGFVIYMV